MTTYNEMQYRVFTLPANITNKIDAYIQPKKEYNILDMLGLANFLKNILPAEILDDLSMIGTEQDDKKAVIIHGLFEDSDLTKAMFVHETITTFLCGLRDIIYPYEEHKLLFPKTSSESISEWGNGHGAISPHSDDIYENIECDLLALTTAIDVLDCPTTLFDCDEIVSVLSNEELEVLYHLDFRVENKTQPRMRFEQENHNNILDKLRNKVLVMSPIKAYGKTGTFVVLDNKRCLHSRGMLKPLYEGGKILPEQRVLFRSKGEKIRPIAKVSL